MAEITWEKSKIAPPASAASRPGRLKFLIGGLLILVAVAYLIVSGTSDGARYFITVNDLLTDPAYIGKTVRISGAVVGDSIVYDEQNLVIDFTISNISQNYDNLAQALHDSVNDPSAARVLIRVENQVKPDLLQHEAQAILTGKLGEDGVFHATELLLKCPTRFEEAQPGQDIVNPEA